MKNFRFKNISHRLVFRLTAVLTFAISFIAVSLFTPKDLTTAPEKETLNQIFFVEIPPVIDKNSSNDEIYNFIADYDNLPIPYSEISKRKISIPNVCGILYVSLRKDGKIILNSEEYGDLNNPNILGDKLKEVFQEREKNGVFEENSSRVFKRVIIMTAPSTEYEKVLKVLAVVEESGANPIVLQKARFFEE